MKSIFDKLVDTFTTLTDGIEDKKNGVEEETKLTEEERTIHKEPKTDYRTYSFVTKKQGLFLALAFVFLFIGTGMVVLTTYFNYQKCQVGIWPMWVVYLMIFGCILLLGTGFLIAWFTKKAIDCNPENKNR